MSANKEESETVDELYGSARDIRNYNEKYYYQQSKETAAVTAIAMLRDNIPPADIRICIKDWYGVEIPTHAMRVLQAEAKSDEEDEALTDKRRTDLSPSSLHDRCCRIRKVKRMCECGMSPDIIHSVFPELSEEEISNICSSVDNDDASNIDDLTLRKLQETVKTPLETTKERAAYLRGRSDKAREVVQDLYCNHGGNAHSIYDFFQDDVIKYEEIIGWKQEAADYIERETIKRIARRTAVQLLQDGETPDSMKENIEKWFSVRFSDAEIISLRRQASLNKCMSEMSVTLKGKGETK